MIVLDAQTQLKIDIIVNVFNGKVSVKNAYLRLSSCSFND